MKPQKTENLENDPITVSIFDAHDDFMSMADRANDKALK